MQLRHKGSASSVFPAGNSSQLGEVQFSPQPEEAVSRNGVGFSKSPSLSVSRSCQPLTRGGPTLPFAQSSTSSPVEVLAGSSGVLREAGSRRPPMGAFPSMMSERTVEGRFRPRLVEGGFQSPVSRELYLVAGSRKTPEGCSILGSSSRADSVFRCIPAEVGGASGNLLGVRSVDYGGIGSP